MWPSDSMALKKTVMDFEKLNGSNGFPNVIGCIDGTHIPIKQPHIDYYNRKGFHSVILQGVCNSNKLFIDIFAGWPGASYDARVWRQSPLFFKLNNEAPHK